MITVFSGDDIVSSRKAFLEAIDAFRLKNFEVSKFSGKDLSIEILETFSNPTSLFGEKKVLAIEGLLSGIKSKEKENVIKRIQSLLDSPCGEAGCTIIIWENREFNKFEQPKFGSGFVFKNFKLLSILFEFMDKIAPGKANDNLTLLHKVCEAVDPQYLFLMLVRQIRLLILASDNEVSDIPSWQSGKLIRQAKIFKKEELHKIYKNLLDIDFRQKTSGSPFDILGELDLLFTDI